MQHFCKKHAYLLVFLLFKFKLFSFLRHSCCIYSSVCEKESVGILLRFIAFIQSFIVFNWMTDQNILSSFYYGQYKKIRQKCFEIAIHTGESY